MNEPVYKTEYRFFTPADFKEEQAYLELRHRQGWAFVSVKNYKYRFLMVSPGNYSYERDFKEDDIFIDDYTEAYNDAGWEFVFRTDENYYFRKADVKYPEEKEVFSTHYDRALYYSKIHMRLLSDTFAAVLCAMFWVVATIAAGSFKFVTFVDGIAVVLGLIFLLASVAGFVMVYKKYKKLGIYKLTAAQKQEKREEREEEEIELSGKVIAPFGGEESAVGEFKPTEHSFEEILDVKLK